LNVSNPAIKTMRKGFAPEPSSVKCLVGLFPPSSGAADPSATLVPGDDIRSGGAKLARRGPRPAASIGLRCVAPAFTPGRWKLAVLPEPTTRVDRGGDTGVKAKAAEAIIVNAASIVPGAPPLLTRISALPWALPRVAESPSERLAISRT